MKTILNIILLFVAVNISAQDLKVFQKETFKDATGNTLPYRILYPKEYDKNKAYPLILFLHGMGERGSNNEAQLNHVAPLLLAEREKGENETIVILPQCNENDMWVNEDLRANLKDFKNLYVEKEYAPTQSMQLVEKLLDKMISLPQVDKNRVSIMGLSMGGFGTLDLLSRRPNTFIKAAPICGGGVMAFANRYVGSTAIKLFHGADDSVVTPDLSRALYDRLQALGAEVSYTEYPGVNHNSWDNAFKEPNLIKWLTTPSKEVKYSLIENISYSNNADQYAQERCKLDFYYPTNKENYSTIVWFHGGGLEGGEKYIPQELKDKGVAIISVNYRLSPKANAPAYIEDAAASVAWAFQNIEKYGGNPKEIYVSGHSAGGYLALMIGMDKSYLGKYNIDTDNIKGLIPISGQTITHNAIRKGMNLPDDIPLAAQFSPLNQLREGIVPTLLITGDRRNEITSRFEENQYLESAMKSKKNDVTLYELQGFNHGTVVSPACFLMLEWIAKKNKE